MSKVHLNVINKSQKSLNGQSIVIFQKNCAMDYDEWAVAWKVIDNHGYGWSHPFEYSFEQEIGAMDSWGNKIGESLPAEYGKLYYAYRDSSGDHLGCFGAGSSSDEIQIRNDFPTGSVQACIYRERGKVAEKFNVAPSQKAIFKFKPTIWIGVASGVQENDGMNTAITESMTTEICLTGIKSADIILTDGKEESMMGSYEFAMENVICEK